MGYEEEAICFNCEEKEKEIENLKIIIEELESTYKENSNKEKIDKLQTLETPQTTNFEKQMKILKDQLNKKEKENSSTIKKLNEAKIEKIKFEKQVQEKEMKIQNLNQQLYENFEIYGEQISELQYTNENLSKQFEIKKAQEKLQNFEEQTHNEKL